ncbi:hypothetical protein KBD34_00945 [Patescibacteria group bacterium]|nr:hypothetical protein [Patescibacteria group bacterium]
MEEPAEAPRVEDDLLKSARWYWEEAHYAEYRMKGGAPHPGKLQACLTDLWKVARGLYVPKLSDDPVALAQRLPNNVPAYVTIEVFLAVVAEQASSMPLIEDGQKPVTGEELLTAFRAGQLYFARGFYQQALAVLPGRLRRIHLEACLGCLRLAPCARLEELPSFQDTHKPVATAAFIDLCCGAQIKPPDWLLSPTPAPSTPAP